MEKTIEQMERELREAKMRERWNELQELFFKAKTQYEGKAFGNRKISLSSLSRYKVDSRIEICFVDCVYISNGYYTRGEHCDSIQSFEDFCANADRAEIKAFGKSMRVWKCSNGTASFSISKLDCRTSDLPLKDIDVDTYKTVENIFNVSLDNLLLSPIKDYPLYDCNTYSAVEWLVNKGRKLFELTEDETYLLQDHPFRYGKYLLIDDFTIKILKEMRDIEAERASRDTGFSHCGQWIRPSGISARKTYLLDSILSRITQC